MRIRSRFDTATDRVKDATDLMKDATDRVVEASRELPERLPEMKMPDVKLPDIREIRLPQLRRKKPWYQRLGPPLFTLGLGAVSAAAFAYFFDPDRGKARRAQTIDRTAAFARRSATTASRYGRKWSSDAQGFAQRIAASRTEKAPLDDATLAHKVETELFRDPDFPKGDVNINAENGVVVIRGQVPTWDLVTQIESRVRRIDGVRDVQNLVRTVGEENNQSTDSTAQTEPASV